MAEQKKLTTEEKQALLLDSQLNTQLMLEKKTAKEVLKYEETEEDLQRKRESVQLLAKSNAEAQARREEKCLHRAGVRFNNLNGPGKVSCLTLANIFFNWNWLIQCVWCGLKNQTPHPGRKTTKPQQVKVGGVRRLETAEEVKARVELYNTDLERHKKLFQEAQGSDLPPMVGPQFQFSDSDGMPVIPAIR